MTDTSRPNFFILLELDPTKSWSEQAFQKALKEKRIEWTRKSSDARPQIKLEAKQYLDMIPLINQIMNNEKNREYERTEAVKHKSQAKKEAEQKFIEDLDWLLREGSISEKDIAILIKTHSKSDAEIRQELNERGITIRFEPKTIEQTTLKRIKQQLNILGEKNLYTFLKVNPTTSISELLKAANDTYNDSQKVANKTAEVTARAELAGQAKQIFRTEQMREAYERAIQEDVYELVKQKIDLVAQRADKTISAAQFKKLLELAEQNQLDVKKSKDFILKQAQDRELVLEVPDLELVKNKIIGNEAIIRPKTLQKAAILVGHSNEVVSVTYSPDGKTLASGSTDKTIKIWDLSTGQPTLTLTGHSRQVNSVAYSPDGKNLASGSRDDTIKIWDLSTGQPTLTITGHSKPVSSVAYSPDGCTLASGSSDKTIKIWDLSTERPNSILTGHSGWRSLVYSVAYSPDGKTLASGGIGKIKIWDLSTGQPTLTLTGHSSWVYSVAYSPDGKTLASGSSDKTIRIWDLSTGQPILTLTGHSSYVYSVAYSPDGCTLASGSDDKTIKIWYVLE